MNNAFLLFVLRIVHATRFGLKRREKAFHRSKARAFSRSLVIKSRSILGKIAMKDPGWMKEGRVAERRICLLVLCAVLVIG